MLPIPQQPQQPNNGYSGASHPEMQPDGGIPHDFTQALTLAGTSAKYSQKNNLGTAGIPKVQKQRGV